MAVRYTAQLLVSGSLYGGLQLISSPLVVSVASIPTVSVFRSKIKAKHVHNSKTKEEKNFLAIHKQNRGGVVTAKISAKISGISSMPFLHCMHMRCVHFYCLPCAWTLSLCVQFETCCPCSVTRAKWPSAHRHTHKHTRACTHTCTNTHTHTHTHTHTTNSHSSMPSL